MGRASVPRISKITCSTRRKKIEDMFSAHYGDTPCSSGTDHTRLRKTGEICHMYAYRHSPVLFRQEGDIVTVFTDSLPTGGAFYAEGFCAVTE